MPEAVARLRPLPATPRARSILHTPPPIPDDREAQARAGRRFVGPHRAGAQRHAFPPPAAPSSSTMIATLAPAVTPTPSRANVPTCTRCRAGCRAFLEVFALRADCQIQRHVHVDGNPALHVKASSARANPSAASPIEHRALGARADAAARAWAR